MKFVQCYPNQPAFETITDFAMRFYGLRSIRFTGSNTSRDTNEITGETLEDCEPVKLSWPLLVEQFNASTPKLHPAPNQQPSCTNQRET